MAKTRRPPIFYCFWRTLRFFRGEKLYFSLHLPSSTAAKETGRRIAMRTSLHRKLGQIDVHMQAVRAGAFGFFSDALSAPRVIISYFSAAVPSSPAVVILRYISPPSSNSTTKLGTRVPLGRADTLEQTRVQSEPVSPRTSSFCDYAATNSRGVVSFVLVAPRFSWPGFIRSSLPLSHAGPSKPR